MIIGSYIFFYSCIVSTFAIMSDSEYVQPSASSLIDSEFDKLPYSLMAAIFEKLPIKDAANVATVNSPFNTLMQFHVEKHGDDFYDIYQDMLKKYKICYDWFVHYPDGHGNGEDLQISVFLDGEKAFVISKKKCIYLGIKNKGKILATFLSGKKCEIHLTFIHDPYLKGVWTNTNFLENNTNISTSDVEAMISEENKAKYKRIKGKYEELIKFVKIYVLLAAYTTTYKIDDNCNFVRIHQFPENLSKARADIINAITNSINEESSTPTLKLYKDIDSAYLKEFETDFDKIINLELLEKKIPPITTCDRDERDQSRISKRVDDLSKFSKSINNVVKFANRAVDKTEIVSVEKTEIVSGKKTTIKNKKIYVKTNRKHVRDKYSYTIYTLDESDYIRMKNDIGVYEHVKIKK